MASPLLIGIAGHSGAGKSTLASRLAVRLVGTAEAVMSLDDYYHDARVRTSRLGDPLNYDTPEAMDLTLLARHVKALARGRSVARPTYDFRTHTRRAETVPITPGPLLIIEGCLALYREELRSQLAVAVFVTADEQTCLARRVMRDTRERGRSEASVTRQWQQTVQPMFERYVAPTERHADVVVSGAQPVERMVTGVVRHLTARGWTSPVGGSGERQKPGQ